VLVLVVCYHPKSQNLQCGDPLETWHMISNAQVHLSKTWYLVVKW
jgi:hypothetical protein